ncbi:MAG: LacI family DNA-binding transcriptional regulator [Clostridia bacterium]|nr:LacI family DNA-binding transcriptional regulator [Clostridia bacterium]
MTVRKPTIVDVAKISGVSPVTVSRVIANSGAVRERTRKAVLDAMVSLNYPLPPFTEPAAMPHYIAILIDDIFNQHYLSLALDISDSLYAAGYLSLICRSNSRSINDYLKLYPDNASGFIAISLLGEQAEAISAACAAGIPLVAIHRCPMFSSAHSIIADDYSNAYLAMEHLVSLGHTDIAIINHPQYSAGVHEAVMGYRDAVACFGAVDDDNYIFYSNMEQKDAESIFSYIRAMYPQVTAIICANESVAQAITDSAVSVGLSVPQDISIITFDISTDVSAKLGHCCFTAVGAPYSLFAEEAVKTILRFIDRPREFLNGENSFYRVILKSKLFIGYSTAAAKRR